MNRRRTPWLTTASGVCFVAVLLIASACSSSHPAAHTKRPVGNSLVEKSIRWENAERKYGVFRPALAGAHPALLIVLHALANPATQGLGTEIGKASIKYGFMVATPIGNDLSWNAGACCGASAAHKVDDAGFLGAAVTQIIREERVDPDRVFVAGFSNGAMMAYVLGCAGKIHLGGIAVVEGTLTVPRCVAPHTNLLVIHQTGDGIVPYVSHESPLLGPGHLLRGVRDSWQMWRRAAGCGSAAPAAHNPQGASELDATCRGSRTSLLTIHGGTHTWPMSPGPFSATDTVVAFFHLNAGT